MKIPSSPQKYYYGELTNLFTRTPGGELLLEPSIGSGSVQVVNIARGIDARFWTYRINHEIELNGNETPVSKSRHFTLVCFLNTEGFKLFNSDASLNESIAWNTIFLSANSNYKINISPGAGGQCLSISFTETWLQQNVLETNDAFHHLGEKISNRKSFCLIGSMNFSERKMVEELLNFPWKKSFGSFYIRSLVLKIVSDFLYRIKEKDTPTINHLCLKIAVPGMERYQEDAEDTGAREDKEGKEDKEDKDGMIKLASGRED